MLPPPPINNGIIPGFSVPEIPTANGPFWIAPWLPSAISQLNAAELAAACPPCRVSFRADRWTCYVLKYRNVFASARLMRGREAWYCYYSVAYRDDRRPRRKRRYLANAQHRRMMAELCEGVQRWTEEHPADFALMEHIAREEWVEAVLRAAEDIRDARVRARRQREALVAAWGPDGVPPMWFLIRLLTNKNPQYHAWLCRVYVAAPMSRKS